MLEDMAQENSSEQQADAKSAIPIEAIRVSRRRFLEKCLGTAGVIVSGGVVYPIIRYLQPVAGGEGSGRLEIDVGPVPVGTATTVVFRNKPAIILHRDDGFVAFSAICTHLGCVVKWLPVEGLFYCPCHAGIFDDQGAVVSGPPPSSLEPIAVTVKEGKVLLGT